MAVAEKYLAKSFNQLAKNALGNRWSGVDSFVAQLSAPLAKALATSGISGMADGTNLLLQNLDSVMTSVLFTEDQLVKQRFIERVPSINPQYQWNRRNQYGTSRGVNAFAEGSIGPVGLGSWSRNTEPVRFFGVQRGTTIVANIAGALGGMFDNPVEEEEYDGTMQLLGSVERALTWGNSTIVDSNGNDIFYDGLYRKIKATAPSGQVFPKQIIDMHGKPMTFDVVSEIAALYAKVFVTSSRNIGAFLTPDTLATLQLMKNNAERRDIGGGGRNDGGYTSGTPIDGYDTPIGKIRFVQDVFLDPFDGGKQALTSADSGSPAKPAGVTAAAGAPAGGVGTNWLTGDGGTVYYTISAFNASGESVGFLVVAGVVVAPGQVVTVTIPNITGAFGYRVYRGVQPTGSDAYWIGDVAATSTANATFVDDNSIMPNTDVASFIERNPMNIVIAQMAPMLKLPLAVQNTTIPFGLLYLHTLAVKAVEREFMVVNIGKTGYNQ
jgi:hypothetical protein